ncbi:AAEL017073-PA [Aedes aegypti]|uniref:AAEL017073-PA n=1 Tax=Aedes aegypti TaxID=7159 RepID=J9E8T7_AEDAE|nr:AAEL017073-PA [Aedes aegypti]
MVCRFVTKLIFYLCLFKKLTLSRSYKSLALLSPYYLPSTDIFNQFFICFIFNQYALFQ